MRRLRRFDPPAWLARLVGLALLLAIVPLDAWTRRRLDPSGGLSLAFWQLIGMIAGWIWRGLEVAGRVTVTALAYSVQVLWWFARSVADTFVEFGKVAVRGFRDVLRGLRWTYREILQPAWNRFWKFIDWTKRTLERLFKPLIEALLWVRKHVLDFYERFVRPITDMIELGRRALRVLAVFHLEWARRLDRRLADLEAAIERPFRLVVAKLNEAIGIINRVVTADGLFQRLAFIRTLQRDARLAWSTFLSAYRHAPSDLDYDDIRRSINDRTREDVQRDLSEVFLSGGGIHASLREEVAGSIRRSLGARR